MEEFLSNLRNLNNNELTYVAYFDNALRVILAFSRERFDFYKEAEHSEHVLSEYMYFLANIDNTINNNEYYITHGNRNILIIKEILKKIVRKILLKRF